MAKTVIERHALYGGKIQLDYWPNSHKYVVDDDRKIGVTTITGIIDKPSLMRWPLDEAITYLKRNLVPKSEQLENQTVMLTSEEISKFLKEAETAYLKKQLRGTDAGTAGHDWLANYLQAIKDGTDKPAKMKKIDIKKEFGVKPDEFDDDYIRAMDNNNIVDAIDAFISWIGEHDVKVLQVEKIIYSIEYDYCGRFDAILEIDGKVYIIDFKTSNPSRDFQEGIYPENFAQLGGYDIAFTEEFPEFHVDGHAIFNLSKKTGKLAIKYSEDRDTNREFFLGTLVVKRGMQFHTNLLKWTDKEK